MKKKFLAAALMCAIMSVSLMPSAFATEGAAQINVTGATATFIAAGGYANGVTFNTTVADVTELSAKSSPSTTINGGTSLVNSADYFQIVAGDNSQAWVIKAAGASWTDASIAGGTAYTLSTTAGSAQTNKVAVRLDKTTASGNNRSVTITSTTAITGKTCSVTSTDVSQTSRTLTTTLSTVEAFSTTNSDGCASYTLRYYQPIDVTPRTGGWGAQSDPTSTISFTLV